MSEKFTPTEMMTVAASRALKSSDVCFVGIGMPSAACNLARLTHAPDIALIYESGTIATKPAILPLSIGDGELCDTALTTVSVPEMFRYWLQGGRITVGFLGGAQIDKYANLNTTVVGPYAHPKVRLPGGGGAPEIAVSCGEIFITMTQGKRSFVEKLDFVTSLGHGEGGDHRARLGVKTKGPTRLITDLCVFEPDPDSKEMTVVSIHPGVTREAIDAATGWQVKYARGSRRHPRPIRRRTCGAARIARPHKARPWRSGLRSVICAGERRAERTVRPVRRYWVGEEPNGAGGVLRAPAAATSTTDAPRGFIVQARLRQQRRHVGAVPSEGAGKIPRRSSCRPMPGPSTPPYWRCRDCSKTTDCRRRSRWSWR